MSEIVMVNTVTKVFGDNKVVNDVSFSISKGEVVAILGPNGAGKTTTISMILGLLQPKNGEVRLFGKNPKEKSVRERLGTMLQEVSLMPGVTVKELMKLVQSYYQDPLPFKELLSLTGLTDHDLRTLTEKLSGGQKRRVNFALALAGNPDLIIFDEPTVGMDIQSRKAFWTAVKNLAAEGKTIIFTTHYLQEADEFAERILLFKDGEIIADGTPMDIKGRIATKTVSFKLDSTMNIDFNAQPFVTQVYQKNERIYMQTTDSDLALKWLVTGNFGAEEIEVERGRLEEAFEHLTSSQKEVI
ncbi:ABC transporter ATP-binding protein [Bacillus sp. AK128]